MTATDSWIVSLSLRMENGGTNIALPHCLYLDLRNATEQYLISLRGLWGEFKGNRRERVT